MATAGDASASDRLAEPLCIAADTALLIDTDKGVRPCCAYWGDHLPGSPSVARLGEAPLSAILAGPVWQSLRQDLAAQRVPTGCRDCIERERQTGNSQRLHLERLKSPEWRDGITYLELNSSNLCNLQCRHCNALFSSLWSVHERRHGRAAPPVTRPDPELLLRELGRVDLSRLAYVSLKGGEPMLNDDVPVLLRHLDEIGVLGRITIYIVSNGTLLTPTVRSLLLKAREVAVCISIDGYGEVQTYIRHGGSDLRLVEETIAAFAAMPNVTLDRNTAVMAYNVFSLDRVDAWWSDLARRIPGRYRKSHYDSFVLWPEELSVHCLQDPTRARLHAKYETLDPNLYAPILRVLSQPFAGPVMHDAFVRRTRRDDEELGRSVLDAVPELAEEMVLLGGP